MKVVPAAQAGSVSPATVGEGALSGDKLGTANVVPERGSVFSTVEPW